MKSNQTLRFFALFLAILTLLSLFTACNSAGNGEETTEAPVISSSSSDDNGTGNPGDELPALWESATYTEDKSFGEGAKTVEVEVIADGYSVTFTVKTDEEFLGIALVAHGIVSGENGPYGLYITAVNGITADYDANRSYWAVSKDGEMLMTGIDSVEIENGAHYELTYTIG